MSSAQQFEFMVMGAGVAGLRAALDLAQHGNVLVVTKESVRESNTHYAQGGIAVAMEGDEDVALHLEDTVIAGDGLVNRAAAQVLVSEGPKRVAELIEGGAQFDREHGELMRTREAAHSKPRILHANGDATGAEISRALAAMAHSHEAIHFAEWTTVTNLLLADDCVTGADLLDKDGSLRRVHVRAVLIAAGGAGQVYSDTTNPAVATGDGIALAVSAGAELADMEFYQFHPTALSLPGVPRFLLSEALRGEGAYLRNDRGERFMERYDARLELAPRDVVARAVAREGMGVEPGEHLPVYLDMRHVTEIDLHKRFPGISATLAKYNLDLHRDLIPIRPAAHYLMGGIRTDLHGCTSLHGLYAAGEAACTGLHGANRLASNSLLEGLVFGARAAQAMLGEGVKRGAEGTAEVPNGGEQADEAEIEAVIRDLQQAMGYFASLLRDDASLHNGIAAQRECVARLENICAKKAITRRAVEAHSLCTVANAILRSALARTESRGAHSRTDYPQHDDAHFRRHSVFERGGSVRFEEDREQAIGNRQ
ncbi:MAG TPA: L-aspartate oxidase [Edaphobacter sp.]|nr:L-aspartate oxidase [Edaphobacter sp.]